MRNEFFDTVGDALHAFLKAGFEVCLMHWDGESFGNGYIVMKRRHVRLRVIRDRDQDMLGISPGVEPERWIDPEVLLRGVASVEEANRYRSSNELHAAADVVFENLERLEPALKKVEWPQTKQKIETLERARRERRFGF